MSRGAYVAATNRARSVVENYSQTPVGRGRARDHGGGELPTRPAGDFKRRTAGPGHQLSRTMRRSTLTATSRSRRQRKKRRRSHVERHDFRASSAGPAFRSPSAWSRPRTSGIKSARSSGAPSFTPPKPAASPIPPLPDPGIGAVSPSGHDTGPRDKGASAHPILHRCPLPTPSPRAYSMRAMRAGCGRPGVAGLTLVELLTTLAVAGILVATASGGAAHL